MIKDLLRKKQIAQFAQKLVGDTFSERELEKLEAAKKDKKERKIKSLVSKLKISISNYQTEHKLGIYGKAKLLKVVQDELEKKKIAPEVVNAIVRAVLR